MTKCQIAANVALAGLDGFTGRMSATRQMEIFGCCLFGRKKITIDASGQGQVCGMHSFCFGIDAAFFAKSFAAIAEAANGNSFFRAF